MAVNEQLAVSLLIPTREEEGGERRRRRRESFTPYTSVHLHMTERGETEERTGGKEQNEDLQRERRRKSLTDRRGRNKLLELYCTERKEKV